VTVFSPTRQFSDQETDSVIDAQGIDAILQVTVGAPGVEDVYFPFRTELTGFDTGIPGSDTAMAHLVAPQDRWIGARGAAWPWSRFKAILVATGTGQPVWGVIAKGERERMRKLVDSYCKEVVRRIVAARLVAVTTDAAAPSVGAGGPGDGALVAPYVINAEDGRRIGARALELTGNGFLHFIDSGGKDAYISANKVRSIFDRLGEDRTVEVLEEGKILR